MPRHLIRDVHEWMNEILSVPSCSLVNSQPRERAWIKVLEGKEDPVELDSNHIFSTGKAGRAYGGGATRIWNTPTAFSGRII